MDRALEVSRHVVLIPPPPVAESPRQAYLQKKNPEATLDRTMAIVLPYVSALKEIAKQHPGIGLLDLYGWGRTMGEADWMPMQEDDGLHLSTAGQQFVSEKLFAQLTAMGIDREDLEPDLPWGHAIDPDDPEGSIRQHLQAPSRNAA